MRISFRPILYDFPLSQFVSSGKLKKHAEFAEHFFGINGVAGHCTHSYAVIAYYQHKMERNWVTRSVPCSEGSLIEYKGENGKPTNIVMMTESESKKEREIKVS